MLVAHELHHHVIVLAALEPHAGVAPPFRPGVRYLLAFVPERRVRDEAARGLASAAAGEADLHGAEDGSATGGSVDGTFPVQGDELLHGGGHRLHLGKPPQLKSRQIIRQMMNT